MNEGWSSVNLPQILHDAINYKNRLFSEAVSKVTIPRPATEGADTVSDNIGILAPNDFKMLNEDTRASLAGQIFPHEQGMLESVVSTKNRFTFEGMLDYDLPQLSGPSGSLARFLALANRANLSRNEKEIFNFCLSFFLIAIGAHSVDETFSVGNLNNDYNNYKRGCYETIIPEVIKNSTKFSLLMEDITKLNSSFNTIPTPPGPRSSPVFK